MTLVTLALVWRRPDAMAHPKLWAEDGAIFLREARSLGWQALLKPYAGYYHCAPRLVAALGSYLPLIYIPLWYSFSSWLLLMLAIVYIFSERIRIPSHQKFLLGLALVCTPVSNEVFFNIANWATLTTLFVILLLASSPPRSWRAVFFDYGVLLLAGLSSPFSICLWPLFAVKANLTRRRYGIVLLFTSVLTASIQLSGMGHRAPATWDVPRINLPAILLRHFSRLFVGDYAPAFEFSYLAQLIGLAAIVIGSLLLLRREWQHKSFLPICFSMAALLVYCVSLYATRNWSDKTMRMDSGRHLYLPLVMLVWAFICASPWKGKYIPVGLSLAAFLFLTPTSKGQRLHDFEWSRRIAACEQSVDACRIPINPAGDPQIWFVDLSDPSTRNLTMTHQLSLTQTMP